MWPHALQCARPPRPSTSPKICPSSCPFHYWCHPAISSSAALLFFCLQSFPASGTFPMSQLFASVDQNARASASASILPMSIQVWFPLRFTSLISLLANGLPGVFSSTTVRRHQFFGGLPSLQSSSHNSTWPLGRPEPWLYGPLSAEWCLCFSTHRLVLSLLSCQETAVFWFNGCNHNPQWFWSPKRGIWSVLTVEYYSAMNRMKQCHLQQRG